MTGPVLARALGPADRGELAAVLAPLLLVAMVATIGLPEACTYLVASRRWSARAAARAASLLALGIGLVAAGGLALLAPLILHQFPQHLPLLWSLCALVPLSLAGATLRGTVQGLSDFGVINLERWVSVLSRLVLIVVFAVFGWLSVSSAAWLTNATAVAALGVLVWRARRFSGVVEVAGEPAERYDHRRGDLVRYGARVWVGSLSVLLILRLDQVLMAPLTAAEQLGFYAVAVAVAEVPGAVAGAVRDVVFARGTSRADPRVAARACRATILVLGALAAVMVLLAPLGVRILFGEEFAPATPMAQVLIVAAVPSGLVGVAGAGLFSLGRPGALSIAQAVVAVVNTALVLLLVPVAGGMGAAVASLIAYVLLSATTLTLFIRFSRVPVREVLLPTPADVRSLLQRRS